MATEHMVPDHPKFFTMYRPEEARTRNAKKYMEQNGKTYFQYRLIKKWSKHRALRLSFGWVLHQPLAPWTRRNLEFTISPAMAC